MTPKEAAEFMKKMRYYDKLSTPKPPREPEPIVAAPVDARDLMATERSLRRQQSEARQERALVLESKIKEVRTRKAERLEAFLTRPTHPVRTEAVDLYAVFINLVALKTYSAGQTAVPRARA